MNKKQWGLSRYAAKMKRALPILLIIGGMILSFASQPLPVVGMNSIDSPAGSFTRADDSTVRSQSDMFWTSGAAAALQATEGVELVFSAPVGDTPICEPDPATLEATIQVVLPEDVTALLQVNWYVVEPQDQRTDIEYIEAGLVSDGDSYTWQAQWPGVRTTDTIVEILFGAALIDPETFEILATATLDVYWYPWVCPVVGDPTATPILTFTPTGTLTPDPATLTPTGTLTPDPDTATPTSTPTITLTPVPPTVTPTETVSVGGPTVTPVPPTATRTVTNTPITPVVMTATPIILPGPVITATPIVLIPPPIQATPVVIIPPPIQATPVVLIPPPIQATAVVIIPPPIQATPQVIIPPPIQATPVVIIPPPIQATPVVMIPAPIQATPVVIIPPAIRATAVVIIPPPIQATPVVMIPAPIQATPVVIIPPAIRATAVVIIPPPIQATPVVIVPEPIQATPVVLSQTVITATPLVVAPLPLTGQEEPPVDKPVVIPTMEVPLVTAPQEFIPVTGADLTQQYAQPAVLQKVDWKIALDLMMSIAGLVSILAGVLFLFSPNRQ